MSQVIDSSGTVTASSHQRMGASEQGIGSVASANERGSVDQVTPHYLKIWMLKPHDAGRSTHKSSNPMACPKKLMHDFPSQHAGCSDHQNHWESIESVSVGFDCMAIAVSVQCELAPVPWDRQYVSVCITVGDCS
jgi:hypothetical protein